MRRGGPEEHGVHAEEGGRAENRADVVRVADPIERDQRPAALRQRVPQLLRARPASLPREDAEPLVRLRLRDSPELPLRQLSTRDPPRERPPHQRLDLVPHAARVSHAKDVVRSPREHGEPRAKTEDDLAVVAR